MFIRLASFCLVLHCLYVFDFNSHHLGLNSTYNGMQ